MAVRAPRLESGRWINGPDTSLQTLRGSVVLLDFFTYGCINCLNNLYAIRRVRERFGEELVVIGVHSAKFQTEGDSAHLTRAIERLGITYPVIDDVSLALFDNYAIKAWPTVVIMDRNGYIAETFSGEQKAEALEHVLNSMGIQPSDALIQTSKEKALALRFPQKILCEDSYLFIANTGDDSVWVCDHDAKVLKVYDGLSEPMGMAYFENSLFIADRGSNTIVSIDLVSDERKLLLKDLRAPYDLEIAEGVLYVAMAASHQIVTFALDDFHELNRYGNGFEALRDGPSDVSQLAQPSGISMLYNQLWFVDAESSSLRLIVDGHLHTAIGEGLFTFGDSDETPIRLQHPQGVVAGQYGDGCGGGRLFIADTFNDKIKVFDPETGTIMTLMSGLHAPAGISKRGCLLYIADTDAHRILRFDLSKMRSDMIRFSL